MVDAVSVVLSAVVSVAVSLASVEYRIRRSRSIEQDNEVSEWYADAASYGNKIQSTWETKFERPHEDNQFMSFDEVQREMNLFQSQLTNHAAEAGGLQVDEDVVEQVEQTAEACREVYEIRVHSNVMSEFKETGRTAKAEAQELEEMGLDRLSE